MGMFDWYRPAGHLECPICLSPLREWQGKDASCALFVWKQGVATPIEQAVDADIRAQPEVVQSTRLPDAFQIYSHDCPLHRVTAACQTASGVWTATRIVEVFDLRTRKVVDVDAA
jgi:hypothetical protein